MAISNSNRPTRPRAATAASVAGWRRTSTVAASCRSRPPLDGPANEGHTCVKGRFAHQFSRSRERLTAPLIREGDGFRLATWEEAIDRIVHRVRPDQVRARPRCDRRPRLLARHQRGLLPDAAHDARRDRHQQHRQLLARLPLADVVRPAQGVRPLRRHRLVHRHRQVRRGRHHRRQPDPGPPGRGRAHQAGRAARHQARSPSIPAGSSSPTTASCTCRRGPAPTPP